MKTLLTSIFSILQITVFCQDQIKEYQKEVSVFFRDILHDSTHYTRIDYINDSLNYVQSSKGNYLVKTSRRKVDTTDLCYNIDAKYYRYKFKKIIVLDSAVKSVGPASFIYEASDSVEMNQLAPFFNGFNSERIEEINNIVGKWTKEHFEERLVSSQDLNKLFQKNTDKGWEKYNKIYGAPYLTFSIPIFNLTYDIAYFEWSLACGGLCGVGYSCFYKRVNGKWKLLLIRENWVN